VNRALLELALARTDIRTHPLGGGCVSEVHVVSVPDGPDVVAKFDAWQVLDDEANGLEALAATETVRVPSVLGIHRAGEEAVLLLERLETGPSGDWHAFGAALADLHACEAGDRYGHERNNRLGPTAQDNGWMDDWRAFNRERRHGPLLDALRNRGTITEEDAARVQEAIAAFEEVLPDRPDPALLHGDLWSGNALSLADGTVAVIDPAVSVGDGLADIAMMQLFGGFPAEAYAAYAERRSVEFPSATLAAYRLYHMLNHMLIFGEGYRGGVLRETALVLDS